MIDSGASTSGWLGAATALANLWGYGGMGRHGILETHGLFHLLMGSVQGSEVNVILIHILL